MQLTSDNSQILGRNNIMKRDENPNKKKRSPTPVPGYLSRKSQK